MKELTQIELDNLTDDELFKLGYMRNISVAGTVKQSDFTACCGWCHKPLTECKGCHSDNQGGSK